MMREAGRGCDKRLSAWAVCGGGPGSDMLPKSDSQYFVVKGDFDDSCSDRNEVGTTTSDRLVCATSSGADGSGTDLGIGDRSIGSGDFGGNGCCHRH